MPSAIFAHAADLWRVMRSEHADVVEAEYAAAVHATNGNLVNAAGRARGVTSWDLFTASPVTVRAYATDELRDHLQNRPRTTLAAFEREWLATYLTGGTADA